MRRSSGKFLMHRVELKVRIPSTISEGTVVPNAPCGVERLPYELIHACTVEFLMHRVELKES